MATHWLESEMLWVFLFHLTYPIWNTREYLYIVIQFEIWIITSITPLYLKKEKNNTQSWSAHVQLGSWNVYAITIRFSIKRRTYEYRLLGFKCLSQINQKSVKVTSFICPALDFIPKPWGPLSTGIYRSVLFMFIYINIYYLYNLLFIIIKYTSKSDILQKISVTDRLIDWHLHS